LEARIGVLCEGLLRSPYSLTEVRILFEVANRGEATASDLSRELGLEPGDVIYTGTPEGVILGMQEIECEVEGLGRLVNNQVAEKQLK
jgi:Fumarylacetoacetate (FAA) hydrolase family